MTSPTHSPKPGYTITPLRPIERNGLRGFGFSIHFGNSDPVSSSASLLPAQDEKPAAGSLLPPAAGANSSEAR